MVFLLDFSIKAAEEAALPACFAMLPSIASPDAEVFVARDEEGKLLGAGGMLWRGWSSPSGFPVAIHVLPDSRRRGVGRALLAALQDRARGEADRLWAVESLEEGSEAAVFLEACGFATSKRQILFEADAATFLGHMQPLIARMRDRKRIPDEVTSVPLADVPLREVARLVAIEFRTGPPNIYRMLEQSRDMDPELAQISFAHSRALMIEDALAGALLLKWNDGAPEILANVVAPEWRRGWVNALLLAETPQANVARGM